jgi:hypothetical protein
MMRPGRKPLGEAHVDSLNGSPIAKHRMEIILKTSRGELTIPEASAQWDICESRFHSLRRQWLQEAIELLEPRRVGRPPASRVGNEYEIDRLRLEREELRQELEVAEVRLEISDILGRSHRAPAEAKKKSKRHRRLAQRK